MWGCTGLKTNNFISDILSALYENLTYNYRKSLKKKFVTKNKSVEVDLQLVNFQATKQCCVKGETKVFFFFLVTVPFIATLCRDSGKNAVFFSTESTNQKQLIIIYHELKLKQYKKRMLSVSLERFRKLKICVKSAGTSHYRS